VITNTSSLCFHLGCISGQLIRWRDYSTLLLNQHTLFWGKTSFWNHHPHCDHDPLQDLLTSKLSSPHRSKYGRSTRARHFCWSVMPCRELLIVNAGLTACLLASLAAAAGPLQFSNLTTYSCQLGRIIFLGSCSIDLATQHTREFQAQDLQQGAWMT
jgi:hypothetical protein